MSENKVSHVFQIYIRSSAKHLWQALTQPEKTRQYFYGTSIRSDFKAGSKVDYYQLDEAGNEFSPVVGEIIDVVPEKLLDHTFTFTDRDDPPSRVTYQIEEMGEMVKLTVIHSELDAASRTYEDVGQGWPYIISGLKSMLETGEALPSQTG